MLAFLFVILGAPQLNVLQSKPIGTPSLPLLFLGMALLSPQLSDQTLNNHPGRCPLSYTLDTICHYPS